MDLTPADLAPIRELYTAGRYRTAHAAGARFGPYRTWQGPGGMILAGRLAMQLGAPKFGRKLHLAAVRLFPANLEVAYYHARHRMERFGPLACWRFLKAHPDWSDASPELRADWLALSGFVAARLRDFDRADRFLNQAEALAPNRPWIAVERASSFEAAERYEDALANARRSLDLQPWFRPGIQAAAHVLQKLGRDAEAITLLSDAADQTESGLIVAQLAAVLLDSRRPAEVAKRNLLDRYEELAPLREKEIRQWLAARRADVAYLLGDLPEARTQAREVGDEFYTAFAESLDRPGATADRTLLAVDLASHDQPPTVHDLLGRYWGVPFPTILGDDTQAGDGLPDPGDRRRAEQGGWTAAEFTLSAETAMALIDAGIPFFVTLVEVGVSQTRLAIGYDRLRKTLFLADGLDRKPVEAPLAVLLSRYRSTGPRATAFTPPDSDKATLLVGLPDVDAYSALHAVQTQCRAWNWPAAREAYESLRTRFPGHRVTKLAALSLAKADAHPVDQLRAADDLLADCPDDPTWLVAKAAAYRDLGRNRDRLNLLRAAGSKSDADPLLMQSYAQMLLADPHGQIEAERLLRRSVRIRPPAAAGYYLLGSQAWERQDFGPAADYYRFACCLDDREDQFADAYFRVARCVGQAPEALRLFQLRAARAAVPPPAAVRALFNALLDRDEPAQAFAALDRAVEKLRPPILGTLGTRPRTGASLAGDPVPENVPVPVTATTPPPAYPAPPDEGELAELLLFRAEVRANFGRFDEAEADLEAAKRTAAIGTWHRTAARVARVKPDLATALFHLRAAVDVDPLWADGHRLLVGLLLDTDGRAAAVNYLDAACDRHPHFYPLLRLRAEILSPDPDDEGLRAVERMIAACPADAWAHRQKALICADRRRDEEARAALAAAAALEPDHPSHFAVAAYVHKKAGRTDAAITAYKDAISTDPDFELAIGELVEISRGRKEKIAALRFVAEQLKKKPHTGDGLVAYRDQMLALIKDGEGHERLYRELQKVLDDRPDLWQAWSVNVQQLAILHRTEEAGSLAQDATERFPLLAKLWVDRAEVARLAERPEDRIEALRQSVTSAPGWTPASRELAQALTEAGQDDEAVAVLERACVRNPLDPLAHGFLAEQLWHAGHSQEALDRAKRAVRLEPGYDWAWSAVAEWSERLDVPDEAVSLARDLTRERPGDPRVWLRLVRLLTDRTQIDEALQALDRATALDPRNVEAHDLKAEKLADVGRFDEALAAAKPDELADELPLVLQGRAAWVEARRGNFSAAIPPMQALVSAHPDYYWGWQQLADWYNETDRPQNYLEAAGELVRLRPDHPVPLAMRGEAKIKLGDRDGGKEDLREALRLNPRYAPAAAVLFDACLDDEEFRDARAALAVLQEHLTGPEVAVKQLQLHARTHDEEGAARAFAEVCDHDGETSPGVMKLAFEAMQEAGYEARAVDALKAAWQAGRPFNPWASIYWIDSPAGMGAPPAERLAAVDAAIDGYPDFAVAYDRRAELLAGMGRFDEALAACSPAILGTPAPIALRGRAAWVVAEQGDRTKAITMMQTVLAEDPNYSWGWRQMTIWTEVLGRTREHLAAAGHLVRLAPDDPVSLVFRGEARRAAGDRAGAREDFRKAYDLDPASEVAGVQLIGEQIAANDVAGAVETLRTLKGDNPSPHVRLRAVQVACANHDGRAARTEFRSLAADPDVTPAVLREAAAALDEEGWTLEADDVLAGRASDPEAPAAVAQLWAEREVHADRFDRVGDQLPVLAKANPPAGRAAVLAYAWGLVNAGRPEAAAATVQRFNDLLRADDDSWARAGAVLAEAKHFALAAAWLADWPNRTAVDGWMLRPLADALRALDRDDDALTACREGLKANPPPDVAAEFRGWLALAAAVGGDTAGAAGFLKGLDQLGLPDSVKLVLAMAEAVLMVRQAGPDGKSAAFAEAKDHLKTAAGACPESARPPGTGRWYRKTVSAITAETGTLAAKSWAFWQRVRPWAG